MEYQPTPLTLLKSLNLTKTDTGRFLSAWLENDKIAILTRNGGDNRPCWENNQKENCTCPGCIITHILPKHPLYLYDKDLETDETCAVVYFSVPHDLKISPQQ